MRMSRSSSGGASWLMPKVSAGAVKLHADSENKDFLPHPAQFPLRFRRQIPLPWNRRSEKPTAGDVGLSFHTDRYIAAGTRLLIEIPLRGQVQRFRTRVVMVREEPDGFEIGAWLESPTDADRARIVERICHAECILRARQRPLS